MVGFMFFLDLVLAVLAYGLICKKSEYYKTCGSFYIAVFYVLCGNSRDFVVGR